MHAGDAWITVGGDAWPEWPDTQRPDMPQQHDTATVQVPSDVHDAFLEGCGGDHQAAESLLRKTLMAPSVAEAVNAAHQHVASNPSDDQGRKQTPNPDYARFWTSLPRPEGPRHSKSRPCEAAAQRFF